MKTIVTLIALIGLAPFANAAGNCVAGTSTLVYNPKMNGLPFCYSNNTSYSTVNYNMICQLQGYDLGIVYAKVPAPRGTPCLSGTTGFYPITTSKGDGDFLPTEIVDIITCYKN